MVHFRSGEGCIFADLSYKIIQFPPGGAKYGAYYAGDFSSVLSGKKTSKGV